MTIYEERFYVMSGDMKVVEYNDAFEYEILDEKLAPLYIKHRGNIRKWIEDRAISDVRPNSRALKAKLGLSRQAGDFETAMKVDAATITDNFWVKAENDSRCYEDIIFKKNDFFGLSLYRNISDLDNAPSRTPELTTIGTQEKGWRQENGEWWLYKNEPEEELISEYITYRVGKCMGYDMAEYEITKDGRFIKSRNFTSEKYNLQHIDCIMADHIVDGEIITDDDYQYNYETLKGIDPKLAREYISICCLDAICENYDRHTKNYGFLTDQTTGDIISLAPNYDNNNSILANYGINAEHTSGSINMFSDFIKENHITLDMPALSKSDIDIIIEETARISAYPMDKELIANFIFNGYNKLHGIDYQPKNIIENRYKKKAKGFSRKVI